MEIPISCSNCGKQIYLSNAKVEDTINLINDGWGSCGSALYCPECTDTWYERNNHDLDEDKYTMALIMNKFVN